MTSAAVATRRRRTQAERSAATQAQLLDATIECLAEVGYARTTTAVVAERAGVSRGAQLHHFPTKADLVTHAMERVFDRRREEFVGAIVMLPEGLDRAAAAVDLLWAMVSGPTFYAWLELTVAARTDPELRPRVAQLGERFIEMVRRTFLELFPAPPNPSPLYEAVPTFVFALIDGLALQQLHATDQEQVRNVLDALKTLAPLAFAPAPPDGGPR